MSTAALSDLEVYRRLVAVAEDLEAMSLRSATPVGSAALQTASATLRGMASAVYEQGLDQEDL